MQLALLAPLGCILGALLGVAFDQIAQATARRSLRLVDKIGFPILFVFFFVGLWAQLFLVHEDIPFSSQGWRSVMLINRRAMINDLTSHHKLQGLTVQDVQKLLGPPDKDVEPWPHCSKHPDSPCLAYDLGYVSLKYGDCLALYYDKDKKIQDWEITCYKYW